MKYNMHLAEKNFYMIKSGTQNIEMRLYDEKRSKIQKGDIIEFSNKETGQNIDTEVVDIHKFKNFAELYKSFDKARLGYYENEEAKAEDMLQFYSPEEVEKYGVVGIEIKSL